MYKISFNYETNITVIYSNPDDKIKTSINSLLAKIDKDNTNLLFLYNGLKINEELTINELANGFDKERKELNIIIQDMSTIYQREKEEKSKEIICSICHENCLLKIKDYKINLYNCKNKHNIDNILLTEFEKTQTIDLTKIVCQKCNDKNKRTAYDFFNCINCNMDICPLCKSTHDNTHHIINYDYKTFICKKHKEIYNKYCLYCKKDLCSLCEEEHINHNSILLKEVIKNKQELLKQQKLLKETIDQFNTIINSFIKQLNDVKDNINKYYEINCNVFKNLDNKYKNYNLLYNIKEFSLFNENVIKDLNKFNSEKSFEEIKKIYNKINGIIDTNINKNKIINKKIFISNKVKNSERNSQGNSNNLFRIQSKKNSENLIQNINNIFSRNNPPENNQKIIRIKNSEEIVNKKDKKEQKQNPLLNKDIKRNLFKNQSIDFSRAQKEFKINKVEKEDNKNRANIRAMSARKPNNKNLFVNKSQDNKKIVKTKKDDDIQKIRDMNIISSYDYYYRNGHPEIISLYIGADGMRLGQSLTELFCLEHEIDLNGGLLNFGPINEDSLFSTFFAETSGKKFIPRSIFIDPDKNLINENSIFQSLFIPEQFVFGNKHSSGLYSDRYTPTGKEIIKISMQRINHFLEYCDNPQGFLIFYSNGKGSGSGLSSLLLEEISDNYKNIQKFCFPIYPDIDDNYELPIDYFNSVLSINSSIQYSNIDFIFQYQAINDILKNKFKIFEYSLNRLNILLSQVISSITCPLRYYSYINNNHDNAMIMSDYNSWLIPFPKQHFILSSYAPLWPRELLRFEECSIKSITNQTFSKYSMFAKGNEKENRFISCGLIYRGYALSSQINGAISWITPKYKILFGGWSNTGFKCIVNNSEPKVVPHFFFPKVKDSVCRISNTPGINYIFLQFYFNKLFLKKIDIFSCPVYSESGLL